MIVSFEESLNEIENELKGGTPVTRYSFGVQFLDRATSGIRDGDLILIGAESGLGKTEISTSIARENPEKKIIYFALEAEKNEINKRILYKEIKKLLSEKENRYDYYYEDLHYREKSSIMMPYFKEAKRNLINAYENMDTFYRKNKEFGINDLKMILDNGKDYDVIIIDHLHYFDLDMNLSENEAMKSLVKDLRDMALIKNKPIILVAHLRKKAREGLKTSSKQR